MAAPIFSADVRVKGLREFRAELREAGREFPKELRRVHKEIGDFVARRAAAAAPARASKEIKGKGTQRSARVTVGPGRRGDALGVIMGMRRRSGWYAAGRYRGSAGRQFEPWVGNQWDPGDGGGAPYYVGPAINASIDEIIEMYGDAIDRLAREAFPS